MFSITFLVRCSSIFSTLISNHFLSLAPTSSTNPDDEDIDIVGDDGNNNKNKNNNNSSNLSSSESSRDLQLHVYGPPQFTEADVLACLSQLENQENLDETMETEMEDKKDDQKLVVKREAESPSNNSLSDIEEPCPSENQPPKVTKIKIKMEDKSKCSKCLVR